jgi:hypothetical protein
METTYKQNNSSKKPKKETSTFREFMGGEFLLSKAAIKWYPYLFLLFVLAGIVVINERSVLSKETKIKELDEEYKKNISDLKNNNQFISYDTNQKLIEMMEEKGFVNDDQKIYKISIRKSEESE